MILLFLVFGDYILNVEWIYLEFEIVIYLFRFCCFKKYLKYFFFCFNFKGVDRLIMVDIIRLFFFVKGELVMIY